MCTLHNHPLVFISLCNRNTTFSPKIRHKAETSLKGGIKNLNFVTILFSVLYLKFNVGLNLGIFIVFNVFSVVSCDQCFESAFSHNYSPTCTQFASLHLIPIIPLSSLPSCLHFLGSTAIVAQVTWPMPSKQLKRCHDWPLP
ncbi:hypothetical protein AMECASPLE_034696 [Ameca splendens]|uniref:Uncharacterized protein n=1 Tax=Ameca splendens TaxID=208324 RepID=A0ABV0ZGN3_9TELE